MQDLERLVRAELKKNVTEQESVEAAGGKFTKFIPVPGTKCKAAGMQAWTAGLDKRPPTPEVGPVQDLETLIRTEMKEHTTEQEAV